LVDSAVLFGMHILAGLLLIFLYEVGTAVVLPTPSEIPVLGYKYIPLAWIFLFAVLGKMIGAYIVFLVGDRAKKITRFQRFLDRHHWAKRFFGVSERFVRCYGVFAVFVLLSIPGFPDTASLYLFAIVGKRPILFSIASGLGMALHMGLVLLGFHGISSLRG